MTQQKRCTLVITIYLALMLAENTSSITNERRKIDLDEIPGFKLADLPQNATSKEAEENKEHKSLLSPKNWPQILPNLRPVLPTPQSISDELSPKSTPGKRSVAPEIHDGNDSHFPSDSPMDPDFEPEDDLPQNGNIPITLQKCCAFDEQLHPSKKCVPLSSDTSATDVYYSEPYGISNGTSELPDWLPSNIRIAGTDIRSKPAEHFLFNFIHNRPECPFLDMMLINDLNISESGDLLSQNKNGGSLSFSSHDFCVDRIHVNDLIQTDGSSYIENDYFHAIIICPCNERQNKSSLVCVNKCCNLRDVLEVGNKVRCVPEATSSDDLTSAVREIIFSDVPNKTGRVFYVRESYRPYCKHGAYLLKNKNDQNSSRVKFWLKKDGQIKLNELDVEIKNTDYCIDMMSVNKKKELRVISCRGSRVAPKPNFHTLLYKVYYATGAIFLGLTIFVHLLRPELRKSLHSYNFIAHNANLFVAYLILTFAHLSQISSDPIICCIFGFATQFFFMSTFFWLSVMCFDISSAFGGFMPRSNNYASVKFIKYGAFAWGMAAVMSGLTALAEYGPLLNANSPFKPNFGKHTCWFKDDEALVLFFYGPIGILLILNLIQYMATVRRITAARRDTRVLRNSPERQNASSSTRGEKHWLLLYGKLFCLMGGTWVFEVVSWVLGGPSYLWYLPDGINALRGAGIFFIFLWQRKFFHKLSINLSGNHSFVNQPTSANSISFTQRKRISLSNIRTSSIQLSLVNSSVKQKNSSPNVNNNKNEATQ